MVATVYAIPTTGDVSPFDSEVEAGQHQRHLEPTTATRPAGLSESDEFEPEFPELSDGGLLDIDVNPAYR